MIICNERDSTHIKKYFVKGTADKEHFLTVDKFLDSNEGTAPNDFAEQWENKIKISRYV